MVATYTEPRKDLELSDLDQAPETSHKPAAWPKVFERLTWADGVVKARAYRGPRAAVFHRLTTRAGTPEGCTESVPNMALGLGLCRRAVQGAIKAIRADGYMAIQEHNGSTYTCIPMLEKTVETMVGGCTTCTPRGAPHAPPRGAPHAPKGNSSSKEKLKKRDPGVVDAKRVDHVDHPGPEPGVTTGVLNSFSLEEERTGTGVTVKDAQAWVEGHLSETPLESQARRCLDHTWAVWEYPAHPYGWKHGKEAAIKHVMASLANWTKFRKDLVGHLAKVGLPKPLPPDADNDWAKERSAAWMDQRLEEAPKRMVDVKCAGCGLPRQLPPGETRCQPCRKDLVKVAAGSAASTTRSREGQP